MDTNEHEKFKLYNAVMKLVVVQTRSIQTVSIYAADKVAGEFCQF